jgi:hypothetical protein
VGICLLSGLQRSGRGADHSGVASLPVDRRGQQQSLNARADPPQLLAEHFRTISAIRGHVSAQGISKVGNRKG